MQRITSLTQLPPNQDLNILYFGASGGFLLLTLLMLSRSYWCDIPINHNGYYEKLKGYQSNLSNCEVQKFLRSSVKVSEQDYLNLNIPNKAPYSAYLQNHEEYYSNILEIKTATEHSAQESGYLEAIFKMFYREFMADNYLDAILTSQWEWPRPTWKSGENWPDNKRTLVSESPALTNKVYFFCNDYDGWVTYPGTKILLWTDLESQIRMSMFKKAWRPAWSTVDVKRVLLGAGKLLNDRVYSQVVKAADTCDIAIKLQDITNDSNENYTTEQLKMLTKWKEQHPPSLLEKTHISIT